MLLPGIPRARPALERRAGAGVLLVSFALLGLALVLARLLSASAGGPLALLALPVSLLAIAAGSLTVLLAPRLFPPERTRVRLAAASLALGGLLLAAWALLLRPGTGPGPAGVLSAPTLAIVVPLGAMAFPVGGIVTALALTRLPWSAPRVYALHLAGAGGGAVAAALLTAAAGPGASLGVLAAAAALAGLSFAPPGRRALRIGAAAGAALGVAAAASGWFAGPRPGAWERAPLGGIGPGEAFGLSRAYRGPIPELRLIAAGDARRALVAGHRDGDDLAWARWTPAALPYALRPRAETLLLDTGGGYRILVALAMGATRVRAVESDQRLVRAVQEDLGEHSGRPYGLPGVATAVAPGRLWLARDQGRYDVVVAPAEHTAREDAGGGRVYAEDHLGTLEGFHALLSHLAEGGILLLTSRAAGRTLPRVAATARRALEEGGVAHPEGQVFAVAEGGLATILVNQRSFAAEEVLLLEQLAAALGYDVIYSPAREGEGELYRVLRSGRLEAAAGSLGPEVTPVTDDRPYPRAHLRPGDLLRPSGAVAAGERALPLLRGVLLVLLVLAAVLLALPLLAVGPPAAVERGPALAAAAYFGALGLGFTLVEFVLVRRLVLLLGSPETAEAVAFGAYLAAAGAGSLRARHLLGQPPVLRKRCGALAIALLLAGILLPAVVEVALPASAAVRLAVAAAAAGGLGYLMGQLFPLGLWLAAAREERRVPWAWCLVGVSGAIGASLALLLSVSVGHTAAMMVGPACCLVAGAVSELL